MHFLISAILGGEKNTHPERVVALRTRFRFEMPAFSLVLGAISTLVFMLIQVDQMSAVRLQLASRLSTRLSQPGPAGLQRACGKLAACCLDQHLAVIISTYQLVLAACRQDIRECNCPRDQQHPRIHRLLPFARWPSQPCLHSAPAPYLTQQH